MLFCNLSLGRALVSGSVVTCGNEIRKLGADSTVYFGGLVGNAGIEVIGASVLLDLKDIEVGGLVGKWYVDIRDSKVKVRMPAKWLTVDLRYFPFVRSSGESSIEVALMDAGNRKLESSEGFYSGSGEFQAQQLAFSRRLNQVSPTPTATDDDGGGGLALPVIIGIAIAALVALVAIALIIYFCKRGCGGKGEAVENAEAAPKPDETEEKAAENDKEDVEEVVAKDDMEFQDRNGDLEIEPVTDSEGEPELTDDSNARDVASSDAQEEPRQRLPMMRPGDCPWQRKVKVNSFRRWRYAHRI
jgi:hypothetical protein